MMSTIEELLAIGVHNNPRWTNALFVAHLSSIPVTSKDVMRKILYENDLTGKVSSNSSYELIIEFGTPEDKFLFMMIFDHLNFLERTSIEFYDR